MAARRDAVVPALVVGLGGVWTEIHDDVAVVPLPRHAGAGGGGAALAARRGHPHRRPRRHAARPGRRGPARRRRSGDLLLAEGLGLIELNPVLVHEHGALAVDALAAWTSARVHPDRRA